MGPAIESNIQSVHRKKIWKSVSGACTGYEKGSRGLQIILFCAVNGGIQWNLPITNIKSQHPNQKGIGRGIKKLGL